QIKHRPRSEPELAITMDESGGMGLEILPDGLVGFLQQTFRGGGFDLVLMPLNRERLPILEVTSAVAAVERDLIRPENQAGTGIPRVAHSGHVAPGIG